MKPTKKLTGGILLVLMMSALTLALVSWSGDRDGNDRYTQNDTIPKKIKQAKDLDEVLADLEALDIKATIELAMKSIDMEKIQLQIEQSIKDIDFDKIEKELKELTNSLAVAAEGLFEVTGQYMAPVRLLRLQDRGSC